MFLTYSRGVRADLWVCLLMVVALVIFIIFFREVNQTANVEEKSHRSYTKTHHK